MDAGQHEVEAYEVEGPIFNVSKCISSIGNRGEGKTFFVRWYDRHVRISGSSSTINRDFILVKVKNYIAKVKLQIVIQNSWLIILRYQQYATLIS
jgi:hypothetical protein